MKKFAIELTKGNEETILALFDTKEEAMAAGEQYRKQYSREQGLINCILAEFDEKGNMVGNSYHLYHSWL